jgi:hypothetical protein
MSAPSRWITIQSLFNSRAVVTIDPWRPNPIADDASLSVPVTYNAAQVSGGEPPTFFALGDLPTFLASGVDPQVLTSLPYRVRHAAAAEPSAAAVLDMIERYNDNPDAELPSEGFANAVERTRSWLAGKWVNPNFKGADPAKVADAEDQLMESLFGTQNAAIQAKNAALKEQSDQFQAMRLQRTAPGVYAQQQAQQAADSQIGRATR